MWRSCGGDAISKGTVERTVECTVVIGEVGVETVQECRMACNAAGAEWSLRSRLHGEQPVGRQRDLAQVGAVGDGVGDEREPAAQQDEARAEAMSTDRLIANGQS